jgi:mRNA interferase RelE/StbE
VGLRYRIEYLQSVVREDIPRLSRDVRNRIRRAIERKLGSHPVEFGKPLRYSLKGARRLRVDDWRVVFTIEPPDLVLIVKIGHRKDVYDH